MAEEESKEELIIEAEKEIYEEEQSKDEKYLKEQEADLIKEEDRLPEILEEARQEEIQKGSSNGNAVSDGDDEKDKTAEDEESSKQV